MKPIYLAPMAGYTNLPFRLLARRYGADCVVTEMISGKGLYYGDKKTARLMSTCPEEAPVGIQIFGSDADVLEHVVVSQINDSPFDFIDFNAGCPAPKIIKNGDGSALMREPEKLGQIIRRIVAVSTKPVYVKTRLGWDEEHINIREVAEVIESAGAAAHTIHGRTREAFYKGTADWDRIAEVKVHAGIPIILNGDIDSGAAAKEALERTGCDGLMIGRAAVGNPFIFREIKSAINNEPYTAPTPKERIATALEHASLLSVLGDQATAATKEMRKHLVAYTKGMKHSTELRNAIFKTITQADVEILLADYLEANYAD